MEREDNRVRLLLVEDDEGMVELLSRMMSPICSRVDHTDNLKDALEMADDGYYNLIILDLRLRDTGKDEALDAIAELKRRHASIIVVSGMPGDNLRNEVIGAGADAFVPKDGSLSQQSMLIAANVAVRHLPPESKRSETFTQHVNLLAQMVAA